MHRVKWYLRKLVIYCTLTVGLVVSIIYLWYYLGTKDCLCSLLSEEEKTYPIDERLANVIDPETIQSGTFIIMTTSCDHGAHIRLIVDPNTGTYRGQILSQQQ